jgi:hypothetical protein
MMSLCLFLRVCLLLGVLGAYFFVYSLCQDALCHFGVAGHNTIHRMCPSFSQCGLVDSFSLFLMSRLKTLYVILGLLDIIPYTGCVLHSASVD